MNVRILGSQEAFYITLLEESGFGGLYAWTAPRWVTYVNALVPLSRHKLNAANPIIDALGTDESRFPVFRVLECFKQQEPKQIVFYAPYSLDTLNLEYQGWDKTDVGEGSPSSQRWEALADLSRNIEVLSGKNGHLWARLGDLRAIDEGGFHLLPQDCRVAIENALLEID
jgi:hypothetical protein